MNKQPENFSDRFAYALTMFFRWFADTFFAKRYGHRAVVLETVAGVPGMAQENVTDKPTEPAEWIMVTNSLVRGGYTISFSPIPMTETACVNAAEFAKYMIKARETACLNIITGDYLNNYLDNNQK